MYNIIIIILDIAMCQKDASSICYTDCTLMFTTGQLILSLLYMENNLEIVMLYDENGTLQTGCLSPAENVSSIEFL